ncbi:MAG: Rrf2 family transcriptional regulator [Acetobacteraceae bacterium]|nr:Rrf2 family transcriptional regulator [Acetobacteraceae bacterium]
MLLQRERAMLAVSVVLDVAFHAGRHGKVSAAEIAERTGQSRRGLEPLLQALSRAGILESVRGPRGGYRLGRGPRNIRVSEVVEVVIEDDAKEAKEAAPGGRLNGVVVEPLWNELERMVASHLGALTIEDLLRRAAAAGLQRPLTAPLYYAI